jgi:hypothetical protein
VHQAVEIDRHHAVPARALKFAAPIDHCALAQHQDVEPIERQRSRGDRPRIADVDAIVAQPGQI